LGIFFVETLLGISSTNKLARDPVFLVGAAMVYIKFKSPDELYQAFAAKIHLTLVKELRTVIDLKTKEQIKILWQNADTSGAFAHIPVTTEALEPTTKKPHLNKELNDLHERESVKQMETFKGKELHDNTSTWGKLTPGAKSFVT
jgi:hypothetical protein